MRAPIVEGIGLQLAVLSTIIVTALALALAKRFKVERQKVPEHPNYYLTEIFRYLNGEGRKFPRKDMLYIIRALRDGELIGLGTLLKSNIYVSAASWLPLNRSSRVRLIRKVLDMLRYEVRG